LRVVSRAVPELGPGEALVEVHWAGICGSDVDLRNGSRPRHTVRYPIVPGHEWSGVVEAIGRGVDPAWLHKLVVGENIRSCGDCEACRDGRVANCEGVYLEAGFTIDGAWADRILVPASQLHVLPDNADLRSAAGIEPAACAASAVDEARIESHHVVGVVGGGTIGMLCTQLISSRGADVTVIDPRSWRLPIAIECGASRFVDPDFARSSIRDLDVVIEAAGVVGSVQMAVDLVRRGGRVVICGIASSTDVVRSVDIVSKNLNVIGVFGATSGGWATAVTAFVTGSIDPGALVTHEFSLDEIEAALNVVESAGPTVGKVLIRP
jgi:2-desacetyl-2-hydroxyethyl bacteriochlorophyllide A dehydrogenase